MAEQSKKPSGSVIRPCTCKYPFQDAKYGKGMRVHTVCAGEKITCTVCGSTKTR